MIELSLQIRRLPHGHGLPLPRGATAHSAGLDLYAAIDASVALHPGQRGRIPTGIAIAVPDGYEGQVRPRSGLADRFGLTIVNSPGTIDADYRGEIFVLLINLGDTIFSVDRGMRIAQLVIAPIIRSRWTEVALLEPSDRGESGFGSTGHAPLLPIRAED